MISGEQRSRTFNSRVPVAGSSALKMTPTFSRNVLSMSTLLMACSESWREGFWGMMMSWEALVFSPTNSEGRRTLVNSFSISVKPWSATVH